MTRRDQPWSDERLAAAFAGRAATGPPAPADLVDEVLDRTSRRTGATRSGRTTWMAAAAALIVAVSLTSVFVMGSAAPGTRPHVSAPADETARPTGPAGLGGPIDVSAALTIRAADPSDRELLVGGFLSDPAAIPCPMVLRNSNPTAIRCGQQFDWLMEQPEILWSTSDNATSAHPPTGPAFQPSFAISPSRPSRGDQSRRPIEVTLIGHFHDRRAELCAAEARPCGDTFVVDRVLDAAGAEQPVQTQLNNDRFDQATQKTVTEQPVMSTDDADGLIATAAPDVTILSRQLRTGESVAAVEPALGGDATYTRARLVWILTVVDPRDGTPRARTFIVVDGETSVAEVTAAGAIPVEGPSETPSQSPSQSPSPSDNAAADPDFTVLHELLTHPISVAEAIDHRDRALDDTELAVEGWAWGAEGFRHCPMIVPAMPALAPCPETFQWIADDKPAPPSADDGSPQPVGPSFQLVTQPDTVRMLSINQGGPVRAIVLGHFDDHRTNACRPADAETCRHNFIVDAIVDPADARLTSGQDFSDVFRPGTAVRPVAGPKDALRFLGISTTDPRRVSLVAVRTRELAALEPAIAASLELSGIDIVWIVRWVERDSDGRPVLRTRIAADRDASPAVGGFAWNITGAGLEDIFVPSGSDVIVEPSIPFHEVISCPPVHADDCDEMVSAATVESSHHVAAPILRLIIDSRYLCTTPELLGQPLAECPTAAGPTPDSEWIGSATITYPDRPERGYLDLYRDGRGVHAWWIGTHAPASGTDP